MRPAALFVLAVACGGESDPGDGGTRADGTTPPVDAPRRDAGPLDFAFAEDPPASYSVQVDHQGLSLVTTVLLNRSDEVNCRGVTNQLGLLDLYAGLVETHRIWADDIVEAGFPTCTIDGSGGMPTVDTILDYLESVPCGTQEVYRVLPSGETIGGTRVLDLITPDFVSLDVDEPGGFPNGCRPDDQITDLILAMGLVDLDGRTVDQVVLNPPLNDVPFPTTFPFLAPAHTEVPPGLYP